MDWADISGKTCSSVGLELLKKKKKSDIVSMHCYRNLVLNLLQFRFCSAITEARE